MIDDMGCSIGNGAAKCLRPNPGDEAYSPRCIFTELGVGYRMPKGAGVGGVSATEDIQVSTPTSSLEGVYALT